jgi:flavin reductase (DIM6/NTAB) family NADH-FMN oxidoreductase RutF
VIGTYDKGGKPNLMTASWTGVCCSRPPCVQISLRKATYTYSNILEKKSFTVNIPSDKQVKEVDYAGIFSGRNEDKFSSLNLTPIKGEFVDAPYIKEFSVALECKLIKAIELGLHTLFVGEILDVKAEESVLGANGLPEIEKLKPFLYSPTNSKYYFIGPLIGDAFKIGKKR